MKNLIIEARLKICELLMLAIFKISPEMKLTYFNRNERTGEYEIKLTLEEERSEVEKSRDEYLRMLSEQENARLENLKRMNKNNLRIVC